MKNLYFHWLLLMLLLCVNQLEYPVGFLISLRASPTQFKCQEVEAMCNFIYLFIYLKFTGSLKPLKRQIGSDSWYRDYLHGCAIANGSGEGRECED